MAIRILNASANLSTSGGVVASVSVGSGGMNYAVNDVLTLAGGNATVTVTAVIAGVVSAVSISNGGGGYSTGTVATTGGSGSGCTITINSVTGSFKKAEAANFSLITDATNYDDCNTARTSGNFQTTAVSLQGVFVPLRQGSSPSGTFTVALMEGATQRAISATLNVTSLPGSFGWVYIPFATPYLASTGVNYQIRISCNTSAKLYWNRSGTAGDWNYAIIGNGDDTSKIASGDTLLIKDGVTLTVDENLTLGATGNLSIAQGIDAVFQVDANLLSSPTTLNLGAGRVSGSSKGGWKIGTPANPIPVSKQLTINSSLANGAHIFLSINRYNNTENAMYYEFYGEKSNDIRLLLASDTAAASAVINTVEDVPASWANGDTVVLAAKDTASSDSSEYTISSIGTKQITLNVAVGTKCLAGGAILNVSDTSRKSGIKIISTNNIYTGYSSNTTYDHVVFSGIYASNVMFIAALKTSASQFSLLDSILSYVNISNSTGVQLYLRDTGGADILNAHFINRASTYNSAWGQNKNATIQKCTFRGFAGTVGNQMVYGTNLTLNDIVISNSYPSTNSYMGLVFNGAYGVTCTDMRVIGTTVYLNGGNIRFVRLKQERSNGYGLYINNAVGISLESCTIGVGSTNNVNDIYIDTDANATLAAINTSIGALGIGNMVNAVSGSFLRFVNYNNVAADNRSWYVEGHFRSANGKVEAYTDKVARLTNKYNISSDTIAGMALRIGVNCQLNDYVNYVVGANEEAPALYVDYDGGSVASAMAAVNTNALQPLGLNITPTQSNAMLAVRLAQKTDTVTESQSKVTWDTLSIVARKYPYLEYSYSKQITATTDDIVANIPSGVNDGRVTEINPSLVAAYTGWTINHATQTATFANTGGNPINTLARLYDVAQYDLAQSANLDKAQWFSTIDGVTYTSLYNIVIDGVTIAGANKTISAPTKTITLQNGGSFTGKLVDQNGATVPVALTNVVSGSRVIVNKTDGTELYNALASGTTAAFNLTLTVDTDVKIYIRKGTASSYYKPYYAEATVTQANGLSLAISQEADTIRSSYPAGIATDFSINTGLKTITHVAGTTVYTVRELYSFLMDYFDDAATGDLDIPMSAQTPTEFTLLNSYAITDADHCYLRGGALTEGTSLWANAYTLGSINAGTQLYVIQNDAELVPWWGTGHIDVLIKVKNAGVLIDSGYVTIFAREYTDLYDHFRIDLSAGGRNAVPLSTADDTNNQTASGTVATYTNITIAKNNPVNKQIDASDTPANYTYTINGGGRTIAQIYEYLKYVTRRGSTFQIDLDDGQEYTIANGAWTEVKTAPFGTFAGGTLFGARGIWLENVALADALNYILIDNAGTTHQAANPPVQMSITNIVAGSRIQLYDLTTGTELVNQIVAGTTFNYQYNYWGVDHDIRLRLSKVSGATAKKWFETQGTATSSGMNIRAAQEDDTVYNTIAIDGSLVSECSITGTTLIVNIDDPDNTTTWSRIYAFESYWLFTEAGMREQALYIEAVDAAHYIFEGGLKVKNLDTLNPLVISGGFAVDINGSASALLDLTGGMIFTASTEVVPFAYVTGSAVTAQDKVDIADEIMTRGLLEEDSFLALK